MPYTIVKENSKEGRPSKYKVCKKDLSKCFSKKGLTKKKATKQLQAIGISEARKKIDLKKHLVGYGEEVKEVEEEPMGDDDIKDNLGENTKIVKYSDLSKYRTIDELLPRKKDYCIILYQEEENRGHWICLLKDNSKIYYFCSYGSYPDSQLQWVDKNTRVRLGVDRPYLSELLDKCNYEVYYNPYKYQNERNDINTCGRYCVLLIDKFKSNSSYDLDKFYNYLTYMKNKFNLSYDEIVSTLIDN